MTSKRTESGGYRVGRTFLDKRGVTHFMGHEFTPGDDDDLDDLRKEGLVIEEGKKERPVEPATPADPGGPGQPATPATPAKPAKPVEPVHQPASK